MAWDCHAEYPEQRVERYAKAKKLHLYPDLKMQYYIDMSIEKDTHFVKEIIAAARLIKENSCVTVQRTLNLTEAQLVIKGNNFDDDVEERFQDCGGKSGQPKSYATFRTDYQNRWHVLRVFLLCLAPFRDEFLRRDRDEHVSIRWPNIKDGREPNFFALDDYPPHIPGFPEYTHGCVVNRPLTYLSKDGLETIYPKKNSSLTLYKYYRWPVDLQRLRLFYRQLLFPINYVKTNFTDKHGPMTTEWVVVPGCEKDLVEKWDKDDLILDMKVRKK